jgi:hypothetical protein
MSVGRSSHKLLGQDCRQEKAKNLMPRRLARERAHRQTYHRADSLQNSWAWPWQSANIAASSVATMSLGRHSNITAVASDRTRQRDADLDTRYWHTDQSKKPAEGH